MRLMVGFAHTGRRDGYGRAGNQDRADNNGGQFVFLHLFSSYCVYSGCRTSQEGLPLQGIWDILPPLDFKDLHQKFYEEGTRHMDQPSGLAEFNVNVFSDLLEGNRLFVAKFGGSTLSGSAAKGLAIVTCMDSRIDPLAVVGMHAGDVKILRNAGARVTEDVLRTLVLATYLLGVNRILIMPHTDCRMAESEEADIHATIADQYGVDTRSLEFRTVSNQREALIIDVTRIRSYPLLPDGVTVGGAIYNVATGALKSVDC